MAFSSDLSELPSYVVRTFRSARRSRPEGLHYIGARLPADSVHHKHVAHRKPPAPARDPPRRGERAAGERAAIACGVAQHHGFRGTVEPDGVDPRNEAGTRGRDVDRAAKPRLLHGALERQRRAGWRVLLGSVMRLVQERAELLLRCEELRRVRGNGLEQDDARRKIRRGDDADASLAGNGPQLALVRAPAGRADDEIDAAL